MTRAYSNNEKTIARLKCRLSMLAEALPAFLEDPRRESAFDAVIRIQVDPQSDTKTLRQCLDERSRIQEFFTSHDIKVP